MENFDFILENMRFHLIEKDTIVFNGWFRDDNPDNRQIEVYLDDESIPYSLDIKKGIDVRQKYLYRKANVSEELFGKVKLPDGWQQYKKIYVKTLYGGNSPVCCAVSVARLATRQSEVPYYIENEEIVEGKMIISGWAMGTKTPEIELRANDKVLEIEISRSYRKDVAAVFPEAGDDIQAGFKIVTNDPPEGKIEMTIISGDKKSVYATKRQLFQNANSGESLLIKGFRYLKNYGLAATVKHTKDRVCGIKGEPDDLYPAWRKKYEVKPDEIAAQRQVKFEYEPVFSIVIPLYNTRIKFLKEMIDSIINQTYTNWELCLADGSGKDSKLIPVLKEYTEKDSRIKYTVLKDNNGISENTNAAIDMSTGEFIVLADHDDIVPANALFECVKALNDGIKDGKNIDVIYSDEDKVDMRGKKFFQPHFKSGYNVDLLCSMNYICHLFVVRTSLVEKLKKRDGAVLRKEFDGAQDHDFILRCCEEAENIHHIPKILYHWRCHIDSTAANPESKMYAFEAGRKAVEEHYKRIGVPAEVVHGQFYGIYKTNYKWEKQPLISIIIPNKDHVDDLKKCMDSINEKSTYRNYEFVIVENNSTEPETFEYYKSIEKHDNVSVLYYEGDFNFSRISNFGEKHARGEYVLLLNNDTEIINPDCLKEMLGYCMREDVGMVGARLYYDDDTIQHAGVVLGFGGMAGHTFIGSSRYDNGYFSRIICAQDYSAVTAACMMVKKAVYEQVGGLNEDFKVAFNDIDFCMMVRKAGYLIVYNPAVELYHYESKSRGLEDTPEKVERFNSEATRFIDRWHKELEAGDPYYNPNLTLDKADFSLNV